MKKYKHIKFRVSDKEYEIADRISRQEGLTKSDYMRKLIANQERVFTLSPIEFTILKREFSNLTILANNLNQIAWHLNRDYTKFVDVGDRLSGDLAKISKKIYGIRELMLQVFSKHRE